MTTITLDELHERLDEVIAQIEHGGEPVLITRDGTAVARLAATTALPDEVTASEDATETRRPWTEEERTAYWAEWDRIGREISKTWPEGVSAVDAVREQRRG